MLMFHSQETKEEIKGYAKGTMLALLVFSFFCWLFT